MHEQGVDDFSQAARIGPDGVVIGPDKAGSEVNRAADQALGNFGIKNIKLGLDGIQINEGNRLNSSVTVPLPIPPFMCPSTCSVQVLCDPWVAAAEADRMHIKQVRFPCGGFQQIEGVACLWISMSIQCSCTYTQATSLLCSSVCVVQLCRAGLLLKIPYWTSLLVCGQVNNQGIQLQGNPTGGGESHLFIKPNLRLGDDQIAGAAAPAQQPSNVQISVGDGKNTATEQLQVGSLSHSLALPGGVLKGAGPWCDSPA